jgi:hypothetical protein
VAWDLASRAAPTVLKRASPGRVVALAAVQLPDGRAVAAVGADEPLVRIVDLAGGAAVGEPLPTPGKVRALAVHSDGSPTSVPLLVIGGAGIAVAEMLQGGRRR